MNEMPGFFRNNLDAVFFVYGLAFTLMGAAIFVQPRKGSGFALSSMLSLLAWFGVSHGINEFLDMWAIIRGAQGPVFGSVRLAVLAVSYLFLFEFGRRFFLAPGEDRSTRRGGPAGAARLWLPLITAVVVLVAGFFSDFLGTAAILSRYLLGFTGSVLAGLGFIRYYGNQRRLLAPLHVGKYFALAGAAFLVYGVLGGIFVPKGDFFPANLVNADLFYSLAGVPVQVFRAVSAVAIGWGVVNILNIFNWETETKIHSTLFENSRDAVLDISLDGRCAGINTAGAAIYGLAGPAEIIGRPAAAGIAEGGDKFEEAVARAAAGLVTRLEFKLRPAAGGELWLDALFSPVAGIDSEVKSVLCVARDFTGYRQALGKIRWNYEMQAVYNDIQRVSLRETGLHDALDRILERLLCVPWLNAEAKGAVFLAGRNARTLVMAAQRGLPRAAAAACAKVPFGRCLCGKAALDGEAVFVPDLDGKHEICYEGMTPHGHYCIPMKSRNRLLGVLTLYLSRGHAGGDEEKAFLTGVAGLMAELIERKYAEEETHFLQAISLALSGTEDFKDALSLVLQKTCVTAGWALGEAYIVSSNGQFLKHYTAWTAEPARFAPFMAASAKTVFRRGAGLPGRIWVSGKPAWVPDVTLDGNFPRAAYAAEAGFRGALGVPVFYGGEFVLAIDFFTTSPLTDWDERQVSLLATVASQLGAMFHRKKAEEDRKKLQEELTQSRKMESLGLLAGGVAHDFNNILMAITSYCGFLRGQFAAGSAAASDLAEVVKAADRAAALTRQLLAFSRKQVFRPAVLDLNGVVSGATKMLGRLLRENIRLKLELDGDISAVKSDPGHIEQVLINLCVNARDAMPEGGDLEIRTAGFDVPAGGDPEIPDIEPGSYVRLSVSDSGTGIPEHVRPRIFEPFFTTKEQGKGTGLGLATVYGIVRQNGGAIKVESRQGEGATFHVYLPAGAAPAAAPVPAPAAPERCGKARILLVEDDAAMRDITTRFLSVRGHTLHVFERAEDALALAAGQEIDVAVTDIVLGGMGGLEFAARLKPLRPAAGLVYITGYTDADVLGGREIGPEAVLLQKPFDMERLEEAIQILLIRGHNA